MRLRVSSRRSRRAHQLAGGSATPRAGCPSLARSAACRVAAGPAEQVPQHERDGLLALAEAAVEAGDPERAERHVDADVIARPDELLPSAAAQAVEHLALSGALGGIAPKVVQLTNEVVFDDLWRRPDLSPRDRSLVTVAALAALGDADQLDPYVRRGLENGLTREQIAESLTHLGFYAGWSRAMAAMTAVARSFGKQGS